MRGGDDDSIPVDLIEVDSPDALRAPVDPRTPGARDATIVRSDADVAETRPHGRRTRRRLIVLASAVVLALAVTGGALALLDARRADARWDALAERGLPLVDLGSPLAEVWRAEGNAWPMTATSDVLVVQAWSPEVPSAWRALDMATGETLWERADTGEAWCNPWNPAWSELTDDDVTLRAQLGLGGVLADPTMIVCADAGFGGGLPETGDTSTISVVDFASGRDIGAVVVDGAALNFFPVGDDVVVAAVAADGTVEITRTGLLDGVVVWTARTDAVAMDENGAVIWPQVYDGAVHLVSVEGGIVEAFDLETGAPTATTAALGRANGGWLVLADGSRVDMTYGYVVTSDGTGTSFGETTITVSGPDGAERFSTEGELWSPWFSDGSMADRIVVSRPEDGRSTLTALDVVTGEELWTVPATWSASLLQVDGVVVAGSSYLAATDLRTGEELWERKGGEGAGHSTITDGSRLAVPITEDAQPWLVAFDIRTGAEAWRTPIVPGVQWLQVVDGAVLVGNEGTLALYR